MEQSKNDEMMDERKGFSFYPSFAVAFFQTPSPVFGNSFHERGMMVDFSLEL
jgi:hypothetical protein